MHQVETSFLLTPTSPPKDDGKDRQKPTDNSNANDKEIEEDFSFIQDDFIDP